MPKLRHVVLWSLKNPAEAPRFKALLDSCRALVPGMSEFDVGIRHDGFEADHDVVLVSTFDDAASLDAYLTHPHHLQVAAELGPMRAARRVLDYPIGD